MFGWMSQTPLNLCRVQEMVAYLATPGFLTTSLSSELGAVAEVLGSEVSVRKAKRDIKLRFGKCVRSRFLLAGFRIVCDKLRQCGLWLKVWAGVLISAQDGLG